MYLEIVCSWCGKHMGNKEADETDDPTLCISHSICPECKTKVISEIEGILPHSQTKTI